MLARQTRYGDMENGGFTRTKNENENQSLMEKREGRNYLSIAVRHGVFRGSAQQASLHLR